MKTKYICIDFDGTCVTHEYPDIGRDIGAVPVLRKLVDKGHKLILHTMRHGDSLEAALAWFTINQIPIYAANTNPTQKRWTQSPKIYANLYIDDAALGCPLAITRDDARQFVDWVRVEQLLIAEGYL